MESRYGWAMVALGGVMGCVAVGVMFSLAVLIGPMSVETGWSRAGISTAMTLNFIFLDANQNLVKTQTFTGTLGPGITPPPRTLPLRASTTRALVDWVPLSIPRSKVLICAIDSKPRENAQTSTGISYAKQEA